MTKTTAHTHDIQTDSDPPRLAKDLPKPTKQSIRQALSERAAAEWPAGMRVTYTAPHWEPPKGVRNPNRRWRNGGYV